MELEITGPVLKHVRSALTCLSRLGQDLDFTCTRQRLSVSTVNSSRTAFGIVHFYPSFFTSYSPLQQATHDAQEQFRFSVNAKALLSTLRPRSANTVEACTLSVHDSDDRNHHEPGVDSGECRIVVYLHCQHGVRKKHSLTYSQPAIQSWARFDLNSAPCHWTASSRVLKDWMTHFHDRAGSGGGGGGAAGTDEVTFYCARQECRLKSFNDVDRSGPTNDVFMTRALSTEVTVDTADFDTYHVPSPPSSSSSSSSGVRVVTFAQKEFKAIINLAEPLQAPLTAHFSTGGRPIMFSLSANDPSRGGGGGASSSSFEAKFVIATTDFDSGDGGGGEADGIKREKSESVARQQQRQQQQRGRTGMGAPLFNAPTPSPAPVPVPAPKGQGKGKEKARPVPEEGEEEDDEFDAAFDDADLDEAFFADLDRATQQAMSQSQAQAQAQTQRPATTATTATTTTLASEKQQPQQLSSSEEEKEEGDVQLRSGVGKDFGGTAAWSAPPPPAAAPRSLPTNDDDDDGGDGDVRGRNGRRHGYGHGWRVGAGAGAGAEEENDDGGGDDHHPDLSNVGRGGGTAESYGGGDDGGLDEFVWEDDAAAAGGGGGETQLGPTQVIRDDDDGDAYGDGQDGSGGSAGEDSSGEGRRSVKRARWNLLGDG